jgi:hypothetical protein
VSSGGQEGNSQSNLKREKEEKGGKKEGGEKESE